MSNRTIEVDETLHRYLLEVSLREDPLLAELRAETAAMPEHNMQIAPEQGQLMAMLVRLMGATRCIEVGTFTGYSALAVAQALPEDGRLVALDVSEAWTDVGRRYWDRAGVAGRIELRIGPALESLQTMREAGEEGSYDFAFIDADKVNYAGYYEHCLALLRPGGLIAVDNVLWDGAVADPERLDEDTEAIRRFNLMLRDDRRVDLSLVPIADGLSLARKR